MPLGGELPELTDIRLIAGGRSNLTYRLAVSGPGGDRLLVLRRPPLGHVLPTAHDMSREFRVLSALADTEVPVARPVAFCDDVDVVGTEAGGFVRFTCCQLRRAGDGVVGEAAERRVLAEDVAGKM